MRYLPFVLALALVIYALVDCVRADDSDMPVGLPKAVWVILIIIFPGAGAVAWLVVSRVSRQGPRAPGRTVFGGASPSHPSTTRRPTTRPVAPDDDPEFLASLGRPRPEPRPDPGHGAPAPSDDVVDGDSPSGEASHDEGSDTPDEGRGPTPRA